jgi:hypothetical protein
VNSALNGRHPKIGTTNFGGILPQRSCKEAKNFKNLVFCHTAICVQAQTANIFARLFTFETGRLPLETEMFHRSCDVSH